MFLQTQTLCMVGAGQSQIPAIAIIFAFAEDQEKENGLQEIVASTMACKKRASVCLL